VISRAVVSNVPFFPQKMPIVLVATFVVFALSAGFVMTGELLAGDDHRPPPRARRPPRELAPPSWAPSIVPERAVPARQARVASREQPAPLNLPLAAINDLAQGLRRVGEAGRRIAVAGSMRNVGTTLSAITLARALAKESRVVLVDLALGSPNISVISTEPDAPGIVDLIRGAASFGDIISRDRFSKLHLVAVGRAEGDAPAILASQRLLMTIDALAQTYDHVVIDAGAVPELPAEQFVRLASRAALVSPDAAHPSTQAARDRLLRAGFADVTLLVVQPRGPEAGATARAKAAA
jgi:Mrp family chromosome partitioning ATPase